MLPLKGIVHVRFGAIRFGYETNLMNVHIKTSPLPVREKIPLLECVSLHVAMYRGQQ